MLSTLDTSRVPKVIRIKPMAWWIVNLSPRGIDNPIATAGAGVIIAVAFERLISFKAEYHRACVSAIVIPSI